MLDAFELAGNTYQHITALTAGRDTLDFAIAQVHIDVPALLA